MIYVDVLFLRFKNFYPLHGCNFPQDDLIREVWNIWI